MKPGDIFLKWIFQKRANQSSTVLLYSPFLLYLYLQTFVNYLDMPTFLSYGSELIRINPSNNRIEYSTNRGASWITRYSGSGAGTFRDLVSYGNEIISATDKGVYYSTNKGASWICRCSSSYAKSFISIQDAGRELLANTNDGHLYYSTNKGASWIRRR